MCGVSVQAGRIKKNKCGSDRYAEGVTLREPRVGTSVHTALGVRTEMSKEEVKDANVQNASTLTLIRILVHNIFFIYEHLRRC